MQAPKIWNASLSAVSTYVFAACGVNSKAILWNVSENCIAILLKRSTLF